MADTAFGFRPVRNLYPGGSHAANALACVIPAGDGTATFIGDFVKLSGAEETPNENMPTVIQAAAGNGLFGVIVGFRPDYTDLTLKHRTASTERVCFVSVARPGVVYEGQADGAVADGDIGNYCDIVVAAGDTTTGRSGMEIDISSTATANGQLQLIGPSHTVGESWDTSAAGTNLYVTVNEFQVGV